MTATNRTNGILITKASGEKAIFSVEKLRNSLMHSGAEIPIVNRIIKQIIPQVYEGISTREIYRIAFALLRKQSRLFAGRYHIKKGIMELGPSGFPFEKYVAGLLQSQSYFTETNQVMAGRCVTHEVDVIATRHGNRAMIECKYHHHRGMCCDVKVPLYIHSRFRDIQEAQAETGSKQINEGWLVTNTRFSNDAIQYGNCAGLKLIGWNYPMKGSLQQWIEQSGLYPITCLTTLTRTEKSELLEKGIVFCRDLSYAVQLPDKISPERARNILDESARISRAAIDQDHAGN